jgi:hypothetical protein
MDISSAITPTIDHAVKIHFKMTHIDAILIRNTNSMNPLVQELITNGDSTSRVCTLLIMFWSAYILEILI